LGAEIVGAEIVGAALGAGAALALALAEGAALGIGVGDAAADTEGVGGVSGAVDTTGEGDGAGHVVVLNAVGGGIAAGGGAGFTLFERNAHATTPTTARIPTGSTHRGNGGAAGLAGIDSTAETRS
jgi:hypothetical protein